MQHTSAIRAHLSRAVTNKRRGSRRRRLRPCAPARLTRHRSPEPRSATARLRRRAADQSLCWSGCGWGPATGRVGDSLLRYGSLCGYVAFLQHIVSEPFVRRQLMRILTRGHTRRDAAYSRCLAKRCARIVRSFVSRCRWCMCTCAVQASSLALVRSSISVYFCICAIIARARDALAKHRANIINIICDSNL